MLLLAGGEGRISNSMHIVLVDDSVPFDGATPANSPLGGAEKAFVHLASALARRGHQVSAVNRCLVAEEIDGVSWLPWDAPRPSYADILIAYRKPELLESLEVASHRILWVGGHAAQRLDEPAAHGLLMRFFPILAFVGDEQVGGWRSPKDMVARIVSPAVGDVYRTAAPMEPADPPRAIATTHPAHLRQLVRLWQSRIHPACEQAELVLYSALLAKGARGEEISEKYRPILEEVQSAEADGIRIAAPLPDEGMVEAFRKARVHLYPGAAHEMLCSSLMESQAVGVPAVAFDAGGVRDRIENGQTGYVVPDEEAFANLAVRFLSDEDWFWNVSRDALTYQRRRGWDDVALEFEALWRLRG